MRCSNRLSSSGTIKFEAGNSGTRLWSANHQTVTLCTVKHRWHFLKFIALNDSDKNSEKSTFKVLYYRITVDFFLYLLSLYHVHFTKTWRSKRQDKNTCVEPTTREVGEASAPIYVAVFDSTFYPCCLHLFHRSSYGFTQSFSVHFEFSVTAMRPSLFSYKIIQVFPIDG